MILPKQYRNCFLHTVTGTTFFETKLLQERFFGAIFPKNALFLAILFFQRFTQSCRLFHPYIFFRTAKFFARFSSFLPQKKSADIVDTLIIVLYFISSLHRYLRKKPVLRILPASLPLPSVQVQYMPLFSSQILPRKPLR